MVNLWSTVLVLLFFNHICHIDCHQEGNRYRKLLLLKEIFYFTLSITSILNESFSINIILNVSASTNLKFSEDNEDDFLINISDSLVVTNASESDGTKLFINDVLKRRNLNDMDMDIECKDEILDSDSINEIGNVHNTRRSGKLNFCRRSLSPEIATNSIPSDQTKSDVVVNRRQAMPTNFPILNFYYKKKKDQKDRENGVRRMPKRGGKSQKSGAPKNVVVIILK